MNPQNFHFIVADDDSRARYLIEFVLRRAYPEATLLSFSDGYDALECFLTHGADAVITDHCMPRLCGAELARALKLRNPLLPVIMVSNSPDAKVEGMAAGVDRYLDKGEAMEALPGALGELLGHRRIPAVAGSPLSALRPD
jgi:CheY-like chemotaxis protein